MIARVIATLLAASCCVIAGDDAPDWLRQDAALRLGQYPPKTAAVALRDESRVVVDDDGHTTTTTLQSFRILSNEGRSRAVARQVYLTGTGKVRDFRAWLIRPSGEVKQYGKGESVDVSLVSNDVYNEVRVRAISAKDDAEPGAVFGFEAVAEDRSMFSQSEWVFGGDIPVVVSTYSLTLPEGWRVDAKTLNRDPLPATSAGLTTTWQLRDLAAITQEPFMPSAGALLPRLAVSYSPPAAQAAVKSFSSWAEVARWLGELNAPQMTSTPDLVEKAQSLTRGAASEVDKIAAIGRFVQSSIRYVAIQTGIGRGGGYRPHAAADVLSKGYGDCKDKANLMRTMLKAVGVEAFPVTIYAGDRSRVQEVWPSPQQFNHAIVAARVPDQFDSPAVTEAAGVGRVLFFDPTDEHTPFGSVPEHEENSLALVVAPGSTKLTRVPGAGADTNRVERTVGATLEPAGALKATVSEHGLGHAGTSLRADRRSNSDADYRKYVESIVADSMPGSSVSEMSHEDTGAAFTLRFTASAPKYAQTMQNRLLVFRPAILGRRDQARFDAPKRQHPMRFEAETFEEVATFDLPPGFELDEVPDPFEANETFASYSAACKTAGPQLVCRRKLVTHRIDVPAAEYAKVQAFFRSVDAYEQSPVVLARTRLTDSR